MHGVSAGDGEPRRRPPELCYDATVADAACGPAFMFAPVYHASWGCRCCTNKETTGQSNPNWDLYEVVEVAPRPPDVGHRRAHAARELISRRRGSRSTELGDSSTTRLTTATADDDTAEDTAYTQDDVI